MSSPMIATRCIPMEVETGSGFPFDRPDRDDSFRTELDDIVNRHPEFAEHLEGFPFRRSRLARTERPFGSGRFERFGFPFDRDDPFEIQRQAQHQEQSQQPQPAQEHTKQEEKKEDREVPERSRKQNIQQSNTVDLGQKQEPVNERNQRSMSAPPDNRQRFVSSIHIPISREGVMGDVQQQQQPQQPQQPQQQQQHQEQVNKPTERVIPIHVEGRDEPVLPKHSGPSFSQPQPQPERIFGQRPSQFTQFVPREPRQFGGSPDWHHPSFGYEQPKPQPQAQQKQPQPQKPTAQVPPQKQQQQQQQQPPPPPPQPQEPQVPPPQPKPQGNNPIELIQLIQRDVSDLMSQVENFGGIPRDKQYLYLDEMLTRNLIKLDNIDTQGQENIRQARKEAIKCIEGCIGILDAKAAANVSQAQSEPKEPQQDSNMEVESKSEEPKAEEAAAVVEEKMEVVAEPAAPVEEAKVEEEKTESQVIEAEAGEAAAVEAVPEAKEEEKKTDVDMNEVSDKKEVEEAPEPKQADGKDAVEATDADDKKEKKKSKKKVAKK